jgi:hypothetical protein
LPLKTGIIIIIIVIIIIVIEPALVNVSEIPASTLASALHPRV